MSTLKSARGGILEELAHAREGAAFYEARVLVLEDVLAHLEYIDSGATAGAKGKKGARSTRGANRPGDTQAASRLPDQRRKPGRKSSAPGNAGGAKLPSTGKGFWPGLITEKPKSAAEILEAAVKALGITPSEDQMKKLVQRQTNALHQLVKAKVISDSGAGRGRRFFRAA